MSRAEQDLADRADRAIAKRDATIVALRRLRDELLAALLPFAHIAGNSERLNDLLENLPSHEKVTFHAAVFAARAAIAAVETP